LVQSNVQGGEAPNDLTKLAGTMVAVGRVADSRSPRPGRQYRDVREAVVGVSTAGRVQPSLIGAVQPDGQSGAELAAHIKSRRGVGGGGRPWSQHRRDDTPRGG